MDNSSADQCPLCGEPNQCAMAAGQPAESCWCMTAQIAPEAIERLAPEDKGTRCICPGCGSTPTRSSI
ncbi:hypothetical protein BST95_18410 [Halioglobus japonicus]|uniref:DNA or RNA helicase of superfamily II n=1 Tax=Halioglobus japonicus TaxID=930805 RepID=A0AAP8MBC0_9GAMM|nr:cysteine-rich CWC family protein [Halioglobus japonicus]AQA19925.1 hypothetical protein BST95_18410 [Halioglobus japonicus]PLW84657.1 hypothetical protein C0029_18120 [Halioglobus japonicus]